MVEHRDHCVGAIRIVELPGLGEDLAPHRAFPDRKTAAAQTTFLEAALPEVAHLAGGEDAVDFAEDVREHGAAAPAGAGDVQDNGGH